MLCEIIQILRSEVIEAAITPRVALVGYAKPVSDAPYHSRRTGAACRIIYATKSKGFVTTFADLDYPAKLVSRLYFA